VGDVFANGNEISAKKDDNKSICAMADVCLSPPSPPAGPIPIPYPNTALASDTTDGSKTVKIGGDEAGLKNKSSYKKSSGDEAATKSFGMGVVSHNIQGPMRHVAWSMDVKFEGENVIRHMDLTSHNHSNPNQPAFVLNAAKEKRKNLEPLNCDELDALNQDDRRKQRKRKRGKKGKKDAPKRTTNTNYDFQSTCAAPTRSRSANSSMANFVPNSNMDEGIPAKQRRKKSKRKGKSNVACDGKPYVYSNHFFKGGHTEPRIVESIFAGSNGGRVTGTLTMKIDWESAKGKSCAPCEYCQALLCAARKCGLTIVLCSKDNKPVTMEDEDCQADTDMRKPEVREQMEIRNNRLKLKLGAPR
jgi:hypothetical protein